LVAATGVVLRGSKTEWRVAVGATLAARLILVYPDRGLGNHIIGKLRDCASPFLDSIV
jgi:hypothetical protein